MLILDSYYKITFENKKNLESSVYGLGIYIYLFKKLILKTEMWENCDQSFTPPKLSLYAASNANMYSPSVITIFYVTKTQNNVLPVSW